MWNEVSESNADLDLGAGGPMLLPDLTDVAGTVKHLGFSAGKDGFIYIVSRDSPGKFDPSKNNIWQQIDLRWANGPLDPRLPLTLPHTGDRSTSG